MYSKKQWQSHTYFTLILSLLCLQKYRKDLDCASVDKVLHSILGTSVTLKQKERRKFGILSKITYQYPIVVSTK